MTVTMREIDEAREQLGKVRAAWQGVPQSMGVRMAEENVEALLRAWWAQGCTEVERPTEAQWREMLASACADTFRAEQRAADLEGRLNETNAILNNIDRQRLVAEERATKAEEALRNAEAFGRMRMEEVREVHSRLACSEIDRSRLIFAIRDALKVLRNGTIDFQPRIDSAISLLAFGPGVQPAAEPAPAVEPVPLGPLRSVCACTRHLLDSSGYKDDDLGHHKAKRCTLTIVRDVSGGQITEHREPIPTAVEFQIASTSWVEHKIAEAIEAHTQKLFHRKY